MKIDKKLHEIMNIWNFNKGIILFPFFFAWQHCKVYSSNLLEITNEYLYGLKINKMIKDMKQNLKIK